MDRLVCGDVGFGKTEVALRAAFLAVMNGRQVAVLCPTTLLAEQHAQNFRDRFASWPVKVAELSRFSSGAQTRAAVAGLADGSVDIAIGTHKLLTGSVKFARLGLIVIDEEHRFGVRQKERLKALRAEVDVLTLTATPIPRTLAMSLEGIRDFSVIATAPDKRLAIKTFVRNYSRALVREAVVRELKRGGQVYYLHNDVASIEARRESLAELVPEARIAVAHGQMGERALAGVMQDFYRQRYNVLLCSTIIETGIDVANANTIIIDGADKFGLAQLHQLRGRVGRSHHQAYAYLLIDDIEGVTKNARKRLEAIQSLEDLGSGFYLSMHDLEIRGAGEVLGESQSGEMQQVGFDLYSQMLKRAVDALRRGEEPGEAAPFESVAEINLHAPALLPEDYVGDVAVRLAFYKRLAAAGCDDELDAVVDDLSDRFGKLPEPARTLMAVHRLRLVCRRLGIDRIDAAEPATLFTFAARPKFDPAALIKLLQSRHDLRMTGPQKMRMTAAGRDVDQRLRNIRLVTSALAQGAR
ncbi:MAG: DEAD/DEAH box helicase, partial [Duodenibacillus sp.]|nr:DEAD/DEAH box helicase [Duodenibacillus sp.]